MDVTSRSTEERLADLERAVRALEIRLAVTGRSEPAVRGSALIEAPAAFDVVGVLTLIGRTLVLIGGAYLLRALTESGVLPLRAGVALAFAYAAAWLAAALRAAAGGQAWSGVAYGLTTSIVALPLLIEAAIRFSILGDVAAAFILVVIVLAVLAVAVRARLLPLAWVIVCGAAVTSVALAATSRSVLPFVVADIAIGIVTLWIGYTVDWIWLRWIPAFVANVAVLALAFGVANDSAAARPPAIVATQLLLFAGYFASIAVRTLVREREVNVFEALQGTAALAIGFGGAVYVTQTTGEGAVLLMGFGVACAIAAYAVAFAFVARLQGLRRNYYFYMSIAIVLLLAATASFGAPATMAWAALAVLACWTAPRTDHRLLAFHGAIYALAAAVQSGLLTASAAAFVSTPVTAAPSPLFALVFAAACTCWAAPPMTRGSTKTVRLPRAALVFLLTICAAGASVTLLATVSTDRGFIATVRTAAIAAAALLSAAAGGAPRFLEAGWLVYPLLVTGGIKLAAEDLPRSGASTLFVAFAVYGVALIAAPRIYARGRQRMMRPTG